MSSLILFIPEATRAYDYCLSNRNTVSLDLTANSLYRLPAYCIVIPKGITPKVCSAPKPVLPGPFGLDLGLGS